MTKQDFDEKVTRLLEEVAEVRQKKSRQSQGYFHTLCLEFFKEHSTINSFSWGQYEPWRDGEETYFEVLTDPESLTVNGLRYWDLEEEVRNNILPKMEAVSAFLNQFSNDIMEFTFGHGAKIIIDTKGFEVEEYEDG